MPTLNVLIVDDDELDRMACMRALKQAGLPVVITQAATGSDGLARAAEQIFDVILLDYRLPDIDGLEVLQTLRKENRGHAILMISGQDDAELAERALELGAQDFLLKSEVSAQRLLRALGQARHRRGLEEALRRSHDELRAMAEIDVLTGLANRFTFEKALDTAVARAQRGQTNLAVLFLDLDHFKNINDSLGHEVGDQLLIEVARRLGLAVRDSDFLARLGGDEFVVLAQGMERDEQTNLLAERIVTALSEPMHIAGAELSVSVSIGIAVFGVCAFSSADLMKCADIAMYRAKHQGRNQNHFYTVQLHEMVHQRAALERDLRQALQGGQFRLHYQAQVAADGARLLGAEALLRWQHPVQGLLAPGSFLQIAEELGLLVDIGRWVLQEACKQCQQWHAAGLLATEGFTLSVNLSAAQLHDKQLAKVVSQVLADTQLPPGSLELEITESTLISDPKVAGEVLAELAGLGLRLALDDFGTGYSSMQHLQQFPIHTLKVDRSFVSGGDQSARALRLLAAIISFARTLELSVVAEGVETLEQARFCELHGCNLLQGYYYAKPLAADAFTAQFLTHESRP